MLREPLENHHTNYTIRKWLHYNERDLINQRNAASSKTVIANEIITWQCTTNAVPYYKYLPEWCHNPNLGGC